MSLTSKHFSFTRTHERGVSSRLSAVPRDSAETRLASCLSAVSVGRVGLRDVAVVGVSVSDLLLRLPGGASDQAAATRLALHLLGDGDHAGALSRDHLLGIAAGTRAAGPTTGTAGPALAIK